MAKTAASTALRADDRGGRRGEGAGTLLTREITPDLRRRYVDDGLWVDRPLFEFLDAAARRFPDKVGVVDRHHRLTYRQFVTLTKQLACHLLDLGVRPGDAVAVQAPNSVFLPLVHLAVDRVQGMYVPLHETWREREVGHLLRRARARVAFLLGDYDGFDHVAMVESLRGELPDLAHIVPLELGPDGLDGVPGRDRTLSDDDEARLRAVPVDADRLTFTMMSSGTTALPKISGWSDNGIHAMLLRNYARVSRLTPDDVAVAIAPAATGATGYVFPILAPLLVGATSIIHEPWNADEAVALIEDEQATYACAIPTQIVKMLDSPVTARCSFSRFTRMSNGGAPLPEPRARQTEAVFGCRVQTMYGATDAGVPTMMDVDDPEEKRVTTVGRCVDGVELHVVGADGRVLAAGEPGEVVWRCADKITGYFEDDDATRAAFDGDGWYHSGDVGVLDGHGYLRIVGRQKDMILRGGLNIFPGEIEEVLSAHPKVAGVAVAAMPDEVLGERACAFVIAADPADPLTFEEMDAFLAQAQVGKYKRPERLEILSEFPLSAGGKVQKGALTELVTGLLRAEAGRT